MGMTEWGAVAKCNEDNSCAFDSTCLDTNCGSQLTQCFSGTDSCMDALACISGCAGSSDCELACYYEASPKGQSDLEALEACAANCQGNPNQQMCIQTMCGPELAACM